MGDSQSKYRIDKLSYEKLKKSVTLPTFQRKLVWSMNEKKNFIETLHNGYPFGAILVYQYPNEEKMSLIDGLQRYTTIRDYQKNKGKYIPLDKYIDHTLEFFKDNEMPASTISHYRSNIEKALKEFVMNIQGTVNQLDYYKKLKEKLPELTDTINEHHEQILEYSFTITKSIQNYLDVSKIEIPTIYFTGSDTELATVFENLNRGGKKLSKYQVFAAQWHKYEVDLSDKPYNQELLKRTISWYEFLEKERAIEIENFDPDKMIEDRKINVAELCFSFGKMILDTMPVFWDKNNDDTANEIGYSSMAIILGIRNKELSDIIADENKTLFCDSNIIEQIIDNALNIYKDINVYFQHYLHTPGDLNNFKYSLGSNFQILSFFGALWTTRFDLNKHRKTVQTKQG